MKKQYFQPTMKVVELQHKSQLLAGSPYGANNVSNSDGIYWKNGGFTDSEDDY